MTLTLLQNATAVALGCVTAFIGSGGTAPYTYSVLAGGAGGTVNSSGLYTAPPTLPIGVAPEQTVDTVQVTDSVNATATAQILVGSPLTLLGDILQTQLGLANGRVYFWNQKIMQPKDAGLYIALSVPSSRIIGNNRRFNSATDNADAYSVFCDQVELDLISRDTEALDRRADVLRALYSPYSSQQQVANSFTIFKVPSRFLNLSMVDGAAIPYRFKAAFALQYAVSASASCPYYASFTVQTTVDNNIVQPVTTNVNAGSASAPAGDIISGGGAS